METTWQQVSELVVGYLPRLLFALLILVVGWLLALTISALVRAGLRRTNLGNKSSAWLVGKDKADLIDVEGWTGRVIFYLLMLLVLVGFFQYLGLSLVTTPLNTALNRVFEFLPRLVGASFLLLIAWLVASAVRMVLAPGVSKLDDRLGGAAGMERQITPPLSKTITDTAFWLILLLFLPAVLGTLGLEGLLTPVQGMLAEVLGFLPNLFSAGLILLVGWFMARILQRVVTNLLVAIGADRLSEQAGLARVLGSQKLSGMLGTVVYVLVLIPVAVSALDALQMQSISQPASQLLNQILSVLPSIFAALVVVGVAWIVGRMIAGLVTNLLNGIGFDLMLARIGVSSEEAEGHRKMSNLAGFVVLLSIMLLASMEAFRMVGFTLLADLIGQFTVFAGRLLLGIVIFALGLFLASLVHQKLSSSGTSNASLLANVSRVSIIVLGTAMGIQQMGIGAEITRLVLTMVLGAVAVAAAIAFGLGSRDAAGRMVEGWMRGGNAATAPRREDS